MHKKTRYIMLGVLCAGLLLIGIGAGVMGVEFVQFSYGGTRLPQGEATQMTETVRLDTADQPVWVTSWRSYPGADLQKLAKIAVSEEVEPGTVQVEVSYQKTPGMDLWISCYPDGGMERLDIGSGKSNPVAVLLACKDQLLADLKNKQLCEYIPLQIDAVQITVNPTDRERITLTRPEIAPPVVEYDEDNVMVEEVPLGELPGTPYIVKYE